MRSSAHSRAIHAIPVGAGLPAMRPEQAKTGQPCSAGSGPIAGKPAPTGTNHSIRRMGYRFGSAVSKDQNESECKLADTPSALLSTEHQKSDNALIWQLASLPGFPKLELASLCQQRPMFAAPHVRPNRRSASRCSWLLDPVPLLCQGRPDSGMRHGHKQQFNE